MSPEEKLAALNVHRLPQAGTPAESGRGKRRAQPNGGEAAAGVPALSEEALALGFAERHATGLRYIAFRGRWLFWDRFLWAQDETIRAFDLARQTARGAAATCSTKKLASAIASAKTVAAIERLAKADRRLAASADQWDDGPDIINTPRKEE
jgi:putative DNA primase/helicase